MKHRIIALALALALAAAPALALTVEEELNSYFEKAEPLHAQLEALEVRQVEIYQEFGLSLDDENGEVMEDAEYEAYVRKLGVLSEDELKTLLEANAKIVALYDEANELTEHAAHAEDPLEQSVLDNVIHAKYEEAEAVTRSIADLDERVRAAEETAYVMGLPGLTDAARQELISMYETQRSVEKQLEALEAGLSDEALHALYDGDY